MIDPSRLVRAASEHFDAGIELHRYINSANLAIRARAVAMGGVRESDVLTLVAATIVLADYLGYSLDDVLTKLEAKNDR